VNPESSSRLKYLIGYPADVLAQVQSLLDQGQLGGMLLKKYTCAHAIRTDTALYDYVQAIKATKLRGSEPLNKVAFDNKLHVMSHALGTHTTVSRVQGSRLKAKREIRVATLFKDTPIEFLRMITVHELAHLKERAHDKAFYQLCRHMEPAYHHIEFDLRLYLTHLDLGGTLNWPTRSKAMPLQPD
jgi:predicted metal-dependent hydrolase